MKNYEAMFREFYENFKNPDPEQVFFLGEIESIDPLKIRTNDLILYANNIMITDNLQRKISKVNYVRCSHADCSVKHNLNDFFKVDDTVMLIRQTNLNNKRIDDVFILIDKVVKYDGK